MPAFVLLRIAPVLLVVVAAGFWFNDVQSGGPFVAGNLVPLVILTGLALATVIRGGGHWTTNGWCWPLGTLGFTIPALGLAAYLHHAYAVNLNGMFGDPPDAGQLFRFLPVYTTVAGGIGFAIGWIVGRNL